MARVRKAALSAIGHGKAERPKLRRGLGNRVASAIKPEDKAAEVARKERRDRVVQMTVQGMTGVAIARELGVDETTVRKDFHAYIHEQDESPLLPKVRKIADARLERSHERLDVQARVVQRMIFETRQGPDGKDVPVLDAEHRLAAVQTLVRIDDKLRSINESRRRLHGADEPERKEHSGPGGGPIPVATGGTSFAELLAIAEHNRRQPG